MKALSSEEQLALAVARARLLLGENPEINVTTVLVMTIDRLILELEP